MVAHVCSLSIETAEVRSQSWLHILIAALKRQNETKGTNGQLKIPGEGI